MAMRQSVHVRIPLALVEELRTRADEQQVSFNLLVASLLAGAIGFKLADEAPPPASG
jgi:hypothetical protein